MATTSYGTPYVQSSDLVSGWPNASLNVANRIDQVSYAGNGINAQTVTSYTLAVTDAGKLVTLNNAAAVAVSLPQDSTANLPVGSVTRIYNLGAGLVTVQAGSGATLQGGSVTIAQYAACDVTKLSANTYGISTSAATLRTATANIATNQSTSSSTFTDLATVGPTVTITTGTKALVIISCWMANTQSSYQNYASFAVSGATTIAASDTRSSYFGGSNSPYQARAGFASVFMITSLTAGSNTFTMKYRTEAGGTSNFVDRNISVIDLGS